MAEAPCAHLPLTTGQILILKIPSPCSSSNTREIRRGKRLLLERPELCIPVAITLPIKALQYFLSYVSEAQNLPFSLSSLFCLPVACNSRLDFGQPVITLALCLAVHSCSFPPELLKYNKPETHTRANSFDSHFDWSILSYTEDLFWYQIHQNIPHVYSCVTGKLKESV